MHRSIVRSGAFYLLAVFLPLSTLRAETVWQLPAQISPHEIQVKFEVDTTWHKVHGVLHELSGRSWLADPKDPLSVRAELHFPVMGFDTDNHKRDEKMREVMAQRQFPEVIFHVTELKNLPAPGTILSQKSAAGVLVGELQIREVKRRLEIPILVTAEASDFVVSGKADFSWADFGVQDPSIFIAKVDPQMSVTFELRLPILIRE